MNPLNNKKDYWVYASPKIETAGKWMLFVNKDELEIAWDKVSLATEGHRLGIASKCSTGRENTLAKDQDTKLICVYTKDSENKEDVERVLVEIRKLGFSERLFYKTDNATRAGNYGEKSWLYDSGYFETNLWRDL